MQRLEMDGAGAPAEGSALLAGAAPSWLEGASTDSSKRAAAERRRQRIWLTALSALCVLLFALAVSALAAASAARREAQVALQLAASQRQQQAQVGWNGISRIAFGSCTSYDIRPQPVWTQGVIPSQPDAWIWLGDMSYMDHPVVDCAQVPGFPECNCTADYMRRPPNQCMAGDPASARQRMMQQLGIAEYQAFLEYMCPGYSSTGSFPPAGTSTSVCPRPIFGVYDDHDSGWNNGDSRNPAKHEIKNVYLDGIGEAPDSPRRSSTNGVQWHYSLNTGGTGNSGGSSSSSSSRSRSSDGGRRIDVVLLDGRYFRESMPCSMQEARCRKVLAGPDDGFGDFAWCQDFLLTGGLAGRGSCCRKDDEWGSFCSQASNKESPFWSELCDPTASNFAMRQLVLAHDNQTVVADSADLWSYNQTVLSQRLIEAASSPMCEMLGMQQRAWLQGILSSGTGSNRGSSSSSSSSSSRSSSSRSPVLTIIASGSVVAPAVGYKEESGAGCGGDDWGCWPRAQANVLHTVANVSSGCVVVITGDFHYSDIKVVRPGGQERYAAALRSEQLAQSVYQVMASGMSESTAHHDQLPCENTFREDLTGLRPLGRCAFVATPAFGMIEVDWDTRQARLQVRDGRSGSVAMGMDGSRQEVVVSLDSCEMV